MAQTHSDSSFLAVLAERILAGDAIAESELVSHFRGGVFAMLLARTRDVEAARDLSQDVMLAVLSALRAGHVRSCERLASFIHGTALNLVNKHIHGLAQARQRTRLPANSDSANPETDLEFCEKVELVHREMERLDGTDRTILTLTLDEGLNPAEISERLGIKPAVVRERKSRAVRRISERVKRLSRTPGKEH